MASATAGWSLLLKGTPVNTLTAARILREDGHPPAEVSRLIEELGANPVPDPAISYDLYRLCEGRVMTRLSWVARMGNIGGVAGLLKAGHDPNAGDPTALMEAIGHLAEQPQAREAIVMLLTQFEGPHGRGDVNIVSARGGTALTTVARFPGSNGARIARMLLDCGADPTLGSDGKVAALREFLATHGL